MGNTCCNQKDNEGDINANMKNSKKPDGAKYGDEKQSEEHAAKTIQTRWRYNQKKKDKDSAAGGAA